MIIGIDIGGTKAYYALADDSGQIKYKFKSPSNLYEPDFLSLLTAEIERLLQEAKVALKEVSQITIGLPNLAVKGSSASLFNLTQATLAKKFGLPVLIENDAKTAALGELIFGAAKGKQNVLYVVAGTGIGGAAIIDGQVLNIAGEFGHMSLDINGPACGCGNRGCLHLYASGKSIAQRALKKIAERKALDSKIIKLAGEFKDSAELAKKVTAKVVVEAAQQGDQLAQEILAESLTYLAMGLVNLINIFSPQLIVVGGGLAKAGETVISPLKEIVQKCQRQVEIVASTLGDEAGLLGALALALQSKK